MTPAKATFAGAVLFALPFLQSGFGETRGHAGGHMDHDAHHGGSLLMLGDHHLEIVEGSSTLELYVSDADRRPLHPAVVTIAFDSADRRAMEWSGYRFVTAKPADYAWADYRIDVVGGAPLAIRLPSRRVPTAGG